MSRGYFPVLAIVQPVALPRGRGLEHRDGRLRDAAGRVATLGAAADAAALTVAAPAGTAAERALHLCCLPAP